MHCINILVKRETNCCMILLRRTQETTKWRSDIGDVMEIEDTHSGAESDDSAFKVFLKAASEPKDTGMLKCN
jgi:hypothetical protein